MVYHAEGAIEICLSTLSTYGERLARLRRSACSLPQWWAPQQAGPSRIRSASAIRSEGPATLSGWWATHLAAADPKRHPT